MESKSEGAYTAALAKYAAEAQFRDFPAAVVSRAKEIILDGLACGLFGSSLPWSTKAAEVVKTFDSNGKAVVWGTQLRMSAPNAALLNGTAVHGFELDDMADGLHAAVVTLPPALAMAEHRGGVSGRSLITAIVAGIEVARRVSACMGLETQRKGFHPVGVHGVFGSAAAAGRVAGLSPEQMVHCFSHAGMMAGGLMSAQYGGMMKRMLPGRAAQTGIYAALLAQGGFTGIGDIFEREYGGVCTSFATEKRTFDHSKLTEGLGSLYYTIGVKFKVYACRGPIQTSLDMVRNLREHGHALAPHDIDHIVVKIPRWVYEVSGWKYVPQDITTAQENLTYGLAVMLLEGDAFVDQYTEEKIRSREVLDLTSRIEVIHDPELDNLPGERRATITEIRLKNGETVKSRLGNPRTCNSADLVAKFRKLAGKVADQKRVAKIQQMVNSLEDLADVSALAELLAL